MSARPSIHVAAFVKRRVSHVENHDEVCKKHIVQLVFAMFSLFCNVLNNLCAIVLVIDWYL